MGAKGFTSNKKRPMKSSKSDKWHRTLKKEKKKQLPAGSVDIEDVHLFSKDKLKNKLKNPRNNIQITGKKQRKLTKRLGHALREKSGMDVESSEAKPGKKMEVKKTTETAAGDVDEEMQEEQVAAAAGSASSSGTRRKRNRGGKKHKKKADGSDDVEMDEDL